MLHIERLIADEFCASALSFRHVTFCRGVTEDHHGRCALTRPSIVGDWGSDSVVRWHNLCSCNPSAKSESAHESRPFSAIDGERA